MLPSERLWEPCGGVTGVEGSLGPHPSSLHSLLFSTPPPSLLFGANPGLPVCQLEAPSLRAPLAGFILRQLLLYIPGWLQSSNLPASGASVAGTGRTLPHPFRGLLLLSEKLIFPFASPQSCFPGGHNLPFPPSSPPVSQVPHLPSAQPVTNYGLLLRLLLPQTPPLSTLHLG